MSSTVTQDRSSTEQDGDAERVATPGIMPEPEAGASTAQQAAEASAKPADEPPAEFPKFEHNGDRRRNRGASNYAMIYGREGGIAYARIRFQGEARDMIARMLNDGTATSAEAERMNDQVKSSTLPDPAPMVVKFIQHGDGRGGSVRYGNRFAVVRSKLQGTEYLKSIQPDDDTYIDRQSLDAALQAIKSSTLDDMTAAELAARTPAHFKMADGQRKRCVPSAFLCAHGALIVAEVFSTGQAYQQLHAAISAHVIPARDLERIEGEIEAATALGLPATSILDTYFQEIVDSGDRLLMQVYRLPTVNPDNEKGGCISISDMIEAHSPLRDIINMIQGR